MSQQIQPACHSEYGAAEEAQLLQGLLKDDPLAWREFNNRYSRLILRCITRVISRFSTVTTNDDTREVYATLCMQLLTRDKHKLRSFDATRGSKLSTWLGMLATHAAYDFLRTRKRDPRTEDFSNAESLSSESKTPFEMCLVRERAQAVRDLLNQFSSKDREFVVLYFGEGLEPEQVAEQMGISVKTVYSKKHKIRIRLEGLMNRRSMAA